MHCQKKEITLKTPAATGNSGNRTMKTFTAAMRTISANDNNVKTMTFKTEKEAEAQAKMWFNELIEEGFVLTNIMLGRLSKEGTDAYIYVLN